MGKVQTSRISFRFALVLCLAVSACGREKAAAPAPPAAVKSITDYFTIRVGSRPVEMQVAITPPEMEHGLMERRDLGPDEGMVFVYAGPEQMNFWMHDCPTALDIGFFTPSGVLAEIYPMYPYDEKTVASRSGNLQFALEMNQGWYESRGVRPGDRLDLKALARAIAARGFDPKRFGL